MFVSNESTSMTRRRREVLSGGCGCAVALVAGCVTDGTDDSAGTDAPETNASDEETSIPAAEAGSVSGAERNSGDSDGSGGDTADDSDAPTNDQEDTARSPLSNVIARVADAADPEAVAAEYDIEYRDGTVRVLVQLEPGGELPEAHISKVATELDGAVIAWVHVDALVPLGDDEHVRSVRRVPPAEPHA